MAHRHLPQFSPMPVGPAKPGENEGASVLFDQFCAANTFQGIMTAFHGICDAVEERPVPHQVFYKQLKPKLNSWKAQSLWTKLDKRAAHKEYKKGAECTNTCALIIGGGPCGLRTAIEIALLGGKAVVIEKRDRFSRNNVLHLWPFLIHDLKALGAKKFFGKFCAGSIDHVSIRTLQCILLKTALLVGVEVHAGVSYDGLIEPAVKGDGWKAKISPSDHPVSQYEFDVLIGADGKRNTLAGFRRKEFRGKLAIAITANFINRNTQAEASVEEISGVAFIFNQKFFKDLNHQTGIDLENIVYYKDETHYFVMTAKKHSLLDKHVLKQDYESTERLLHPDNVNQKNLEDYAKQAADFSTKLQLPSLDFAHNQYGQPDVSMFDFTSIYAAEHASRVTERKGSKLLVGLVGDSLLEPFWPTGSGCARGFFGAFDTCWMIRSWASGKKTPLEVMAERESVYQLLSQTTPENISKNCHTYTMNPNSRYPNLHSHFFQPHQMKNQYDGEDMAYLNEIVQISVQKSSQYEWMKDSHHLLRWFQRQLEPYRNVIRVLDLTKSWRNGIALCCLIHRYRPHLMGVDIHSLDPNNVLQNNQLAFDIAEKEFGIEPVLTAQDLADTEVPDKMSMVAYLSRFFTLFRKESIEPDVSKQKLENKEQRAKQHARMIKRVRHNREEMQYKEDKEKKYEREGANVRRRRKPLYVYGVTKRRVKDLSGETQDQSEPRRRFHKDSDLAAYQSGSGKVTDLAKGLAIKFSGKEDPNLPASHKPKGFVVGLSHQAEMCYFCKEPVYLMERYTAEGLYFHQSCFQCHYCGVNLKLATYSMERHREGVARFFCPQHHGMKTKHRRPPRRQAEKPALTSKFEPPSDRPNERIEYVTESEVEESEMDQTTHNLSSSMLNLNDEIDSDSSTDDDADGNYDGNLSEGETSWALMASANKAVRKVGKARRQWSSDSDTETETAGASDADYETETETEKEDEPERMPRKKPTDFGQSHLKPPQPPLPKEIKPSPTSIESMKSRMSFFDIPTEPVRIDPFAFFGMKKTPAPSVDGGPEDKNDEDETVADSKDDTDNTTEGGAAEEATAKVAKSSSKRKHHVVGDVSVEMAAEMHDTVSLVDLDNESSTEDEDEEEVEYFTDSDEFMAGVGPDQEVASFESASSDEFYEEDGDVIEDSSTQSKISESEETSDSVIPDLGQRSSGCTPDADEILADDISDNVEESDLTKSVPADDKPDSEEKLPTPLTISMPDQQDIVTHGKSEEVPPTDTMQTEEAVATKSEPLPPTNTELLSPVSREMTPESTTATSPSPVTSPSVTSPDSTPGWPAAPRSKRSIVRKRTLPGQVISTKIQAIREPAKIYPPRPVIPPVVPTNLDDIPLIDDAEEICTVEMDAPEIKWVSTTVIQDENVVQSGPPEISKSPTPDRQLEVSEAIDAEKTSEPPLVDEDAEHLQPGDEDMDKESIDTGDMLSDNYSRDATPGFDELDDLMKENEFKELATPSSPAPVCLEEALVIEELIADAIADEDQRMSPELQESMPSDVEGDSVEVNTKDNNEHVEPIVEVDMDSQPVVSEFETVEIEGESSQNGEKSQSDDMIQVESCDDRGRLDVCQNQPQEADGSTGSSPEINNEAAHEEGDTESMNAIENSESDVNSEIATRLSPELKVEGVEAVVSEYVPPEEAFQDHMAPPVVDDSIETSNSEVSEMGICKQEGTPDQDGSVLDESYTTCPGSLQTSRRDSGGDGSTPAEQEGDSHLQELIENLADNIVSAVVQEAIEEAQKMQEIIITSPEDDEYVTESQDNDGGLDLRLKSSSSGSSSSHDPGHLIYGSSDTGTSPGLSPQGVKTPPKATIDEFDDLDSMSNATSLSSVRRDSADVMNLDSDAERKDSKLNSPTAEPGVVHDESQGDSFTTCPGSLHSSIDISREDNMTNSVIQTADHPPQPAVTVTEEPVSEEVVVPDTLVMPESPSAASGSIRALGSSPEVTTPLGSDLMEETDTTATVSTEDTLTTGAPVEYATGDSLDDSEGEVPSPIKDDCEQAATIDGEIEIEKAIVHESEEKHEPDVTEESDVNVTDEIKETVSETVDELMPEYTSEIDTIQNKSEPEEPKEPKEEKMPFENKHGDVVTKQDDEAVPDKAEDCISDIESGKENIAEKASELLLRRPRSAQDKEKSLLRRLDKLVIGERDSSVRMSLPNMDEKYGHILKEHRAKVRLSAGVAEELNGSHSVSAENLKFLYAKDGTPEPVKAIDLKEETPKTIEKEAPDDKNEQPKEEKKDTPEPEPERKLSEKRRTVLRARVSARDVISAKRKFFCEPPRPVQIDPKSIFSQIPMAHRKQEPSTKFGWSQSMDTPVSVSPTTAMPRSNSASGDADFTLITSQLPKPEKGATKDAVAVNGVSEKAELSVDVAGHPSDSSSISPNPSVSLSSDTASNPSPAVLRREAESSERSSSQSTAEASDSPKTATLERKQEEHHKRKSFLAKILPSKRRDKVEKSEVKAEKKARSEEKSKKRKKASESKRAEKERANIPVGYILREVGPMGAHLKRQRHHRGRGKQPSIQERIEAVAPAPGLYRRETPPRATIDEMDNESDTVSLSSSKTATEKELLRERRKQKQLLERQRKAEERKRLRKAQEIQRLLEEVGQKQKIVEQRGVTIEKKLRQNASHGVPEEGQQMEQWFNLVHEKNVLARYESELMIRARELELQDRHSRLERRLRESAADTTHRSEDEEAEEQRILKELVEIVEQRDALVRLLEEDRVRERDVDDELKQVMNRIGYELSPILYLKSLSLSSVNIDPNELLE